MYIDVRFLERSTNIHAVLYPENLYFIMSSEIDPYVCNYVYSNDLCLTSV